ncbi:MAG: polysaccharide biosynthesis C-terminal domain-containing protein, partial [Clostridia bacterium]|nr:polysaccharide biosynthesis C-terminal domain-containing protein [Clostridia bacterium]
IKGAPYGSLAFYVFIVVFGLIILCRTTEVKIDIVSTFGKPLLCALLCGAAAFGAVRLMGMVTSTRLITLVAIGIAGVVYVISLFALKTLTKNDILLLPKGEKMLKVLEKRGWIV